MSKRHWHVLSGLQGCYMPNSNYAHRTLKEAEADAADQAEYARDEEYRVEGSARSRWYSVGEHQCIQIVDCYEADCWCGCGEPLNDVYCYVGDDTCTAVPVGAIN